MNNNNYRKIPERKGKTFSGIFARIAVFAIITCLLISVPGCDSIKQFMFKSTEENQAELPGQKENTTESSKADTEAGVSLESEETANANDLSNEVENTRSSSGQDTAAQFSDSGYGSVDRDLQRENFKKGIEFFEEENYIIAEFYFNKIKDTYKILSDHILYYYAKSLLLQEKYESAEENYFKLKTGFPDSIFNEKASLEYADLFFLIGDYLTAEAGYESFIQDFPGSGLIAYSTYQLAACQQKNNKLTAAFENYKKIWLEHPESEYADKSYEAIEFLEKEDAIEKFIPTNDEIYRRGEIFFDLYRYENALQEFDKILESSKTGDLGASLHAKTLFKTGMCYYNMRDYGTSKDYLSLSYSKFSTSGYADDCLYFLGRAHTNLDQESTALEKYDELLSKFAGSNYADDALYRIGRIYFLDDDLASAEKYYQQIIDEYPGGDKITEIYWELGWIQYRNGDYSRAKNTFSGMAARFGSNQLGEKGYFWLAKCNEKTGEKQGAIENYRKIIDIGSYSYYTFAAKTALERLGESAELAKINTSVYPDNPEIEKLLPDIFKDSDESGNKGNDTDPGEFSHLDKAKELLIIEFCDSAATEIEAASSEIADDSTSILEISTLYLRAKDYINSQKIITKNLTKLKNSLSSPYEDYLHYLLYPYGYREYVDKYSAEYGVDPLFILAVIREESRFQPDAGSYAGALGLMQIMPNTGKSIASSIGISGFNNDMLFDPEKSIRMGTYYIRAQLDNFNQNKYYACGAYNGGPGAMSKWISKYGDRDIDEFIENISYDETRNYVKKVIGSYFFYQLLYGSGN